MLDDSAAQAPAGEVTQAIAQPTEGPAPIPIIIVRLELPVVASHPNPASNARSRWHVSATRFKGPSRRSQKIEEMPAVSMESLQDRRAGTVEFVS